MQSINPRPLKSVQDERGAVAVVFALVALVVIMAAGGAVDYGRWYTAKRATTAALDAAVLAGARALQLDPGNPSAALAIAGQTYAANLVNRLPVLNDTVTFITADSGKSVTATGSAAISTSILGVTGIFSLPLISTSGAGFPKAMITVGGSGGSNIEISVMLDVTGSMCDDGNGPCTTGTKISGLKTAAAHLVDIAISDDQSTFTSRAAIVPFATRIRVDPNGSGTMMKILTNLDPDWTGWYKMCTQSSGSGGSESGGNWTCQQYSTQHYSNWPIKPCVTDRFYDNGWVFDATESAPQSGAWLNAHDGSRMTVATDSSDTAATTQTGQTKSDPAQHWNYDDGTCADEAEANIVVPLTSDKTKLKASINGLTAYGATAGALGTAWSWYMLSPQWGTIWTGPSMPAPYTDLTTRQANGAPKLRKVAILMTDGGYNTFRGWKDQDQQTVSNWALQVCSNMKARGIEIYTVGFALNELSTTEQTIARATLQACGSDISHFYETINVSQLQTAFTQIAANLSGISLVQ